MAKLFRKKNEDDPQRPKGGAPPSMSGMSRDMKRMMAKRDRAGDRLKRPPVATRKRTKPRQFFKEVRGELGRVAWPNRREVLTYTVVVLVSVAFFMALIGGFDFLFSKGVLELLTRGGAGGR